MEEKSEKFEIVGVRFKEAGKIYYFDPAGLTLEENTDVIVETARGIEFGKIITPNKTVDSNEVVLPLKKVVRIADEKDKKKHDENCATCERAKKIWAEKAAEHKLEMSLVDAEYTFDNNKLLFYFTSEGRVDFREFVKDLAGIFKTRIELRQIGVRDEAKHLGGIGACGRPFCCKTFLNDFEQVSIKMAKEQGLSLNSVKISGTCGRLMCCLRFENDLYEAESKKTPSVGSIVSTPDGKGVVVESNVLSGMVKVSLDKNKEAAPGVYMRDSLKIISRAKNDNSEISGEDLPQN